MKTLEEYVKEAATFTQRDADLTFGESVGKYIQHQIGMLDLFVMTGRDEMAAEARNRILGAALLLQE